MKTTFCLLALLLLPGAGLAQGRRAKPSAKPAPSGAHLPPAATTVDARAERAAQLIEDIELLTTLNKLNLGREQAGTLAAAVEEAWEARRRRRAEENVELAAMEEVLAQTRAAMMTGPGVPQEYLDRLNGQVDTIILTTQQVETDIARALAQRVNEIIPSGQMERILPTSSAAPPTPGGKAGDAQTVSDEPSPASKVTDALMKLRALTPAEYAEARGRLAAKLLGEATSSPDYERRKGQVLAAIDRARQLGDAQFAQEQGALSEMLLEQVRTTEHVGMMTKLRAAPQATYEEARPKVAEMLLSGLDPASPQYVQIKDDFLAFADRVRSLHPDEFEREKINLAQQMGERRRRLEEAQRERRQRALERRRQSQAAEQRRRAFEHFVSHILMNPRTLTLLKEKAKG